jgi:hypothetical protein
MRKLFAAVLFAVTFASVGGTYAAGECGPGCHSAANGGCVVDGWGTGARIWNECPAGAHPRPPCGHDYVWRPRLRACFQR